MSFVISSYLLSMSAMRRSLFIFVACVFATLPLRFAFAEDAAIRTPPETPAPTRAVSLTIRDGATLIWSGGVSVPDSNTATTTLIATDGAQADALAASALAALVAADAAAPEFSISNLQYFSSFGSFYVKCIAYTLEQCDNWQYAVGATYPTIGMDKFLMRDGDTLFIYFGSPRRITLSTSTVAVHKPFTASAEMYVPSSDSYIPAAGVTIGITQTNPDDPYTPLVIATLTADAAGSATFSLGEVGTYSVGIAEDYYYPSVTLTVAPVPSDAPRGSIGGGTDERKEVDKEVDIGSALAFLSARQREDGSFASPLLSDWTALAFAGTPEEEPGETLLRRHLASTPFSSQTATDYERRAMALMALRVNPYSGTATDYIGKILSYFDGSQFGDPALVNDDIFALLPLLRASYGAGDEPIARALAFILSTQRSDGSFEGSIDLTAAAIQALAPLEAESGVTSALSRAREYLRARQMADGGFGNSFSTSWALQAIAASGNDLSLWQSVQGKNPREYLASLQFGDGGWEAPREDVHTRVWATAYAIPAALGKSWPALLASFEKPAVVQADATTIKPAPLSTSSAGAATETSIPILGETSTTTQGDIITATSTPFAQASTSEPVISSFNLMDAPTTTPNAAIPRIAVYSGSSLQANTASGKPATLRAQDAQTPGRVGAPIPANSADAPLTYAAAVVAAPDANGLPRLLARMVGWFERTLIALRALLF